MTTALIWLMLIFGLFLGGFLNALVEHLPGHLAKEQESRLRFCTRFFQAAPHRHFFSRVRRYLPLIHGQSYQRFGLELFTALMSTALAYLFGPSLALLGALVLTWFLIPAGMIDWQHQILPDDLTLPLIWLGLIFNLQGLFAPLDAAVLGAVIGYLSFWTLFWAFKWFSGKEGLGYGDFKLMAALGAWFGFGALPFLILISSLLGLALAIYFKLCDRQDFSKPLAFGPCLMVAAWIWLINTSLHLSTLGGLSP